MYQYTFFANIEFITQKKLVSPILHSVLPLYTFPLILYYIRTLATVIIVQPPSSAISTICTATKTSPDERQSCLRVMEIGRIVYGEEDKGGEED